MSNIFWDKIRILVTSRCNYRCSFCHNEGQPKNKSMAQLSYNQLKTLIDIIFDQNVSEICFSGGEPFLNKDIVKMIQYASYNTACDISCATNLSLITDEQIEELSKTRVKFNIQFPFITDNKFKESTGRGNLSSILDTIKKVKLSGIELGLNTVIQSNDMESVSQMVDFALSNELPLKLLPQIGLVESGNYKENVFPILQKRAIDCVDKGTGAIRFTLQDGDHKTTVLYIDSPCFTNDIKRCRQYGEVRLLPDMKLQACLLKDDALPLDIEKGKEYVINQFRQLWNSFNHC